MLVSTDNWLETETGLWLWDLQCKEQQILQCRPQFWHKTIWCIYWATLHQDIHGTKNITDSAYAHFIEQRLYFCSCHSVCSLKAVRAWKHHPHKYNHQQKQDKMFVQGERHALCVQCCAFEKSPEVDDYRLWAPCFGTCVAWTETALYNCSYTWLRHKILSCRC